MFLVESKDGFMTKLMSPPKITVPSVKLPTLDITGSRKEIWLELGRYKLTKVIRDPRSVPFTKRAPSSASSHRSLNCHGVEPQIKMLTPLDLESEEQPWYTVGKRLSWSLSVLSARKWVS